MEAWDIAQRQVFIPASLDFLQICWENAYTWMMIRLFWFMQHASDKNNPPWQFSRQKTNPMNESGLYWSDHVPEILLHSNWLNAVYSVSYTSVNCSSESWTYFTDKKSSLFNKKSL